MTSKAGHTAGPWRALRDRTVVSRNKRIADCRANDSTTVDEADANANLIAEGGTVYHETGLTPRQLVEQRSEWKALAVGLAAHLENIERHMCVQTGKVGAAHAAEGQELREAGRKLIALSRAAIAKAEGSAHA